MKLNSRKFAASSGPRKQDGFTLIEVILAVSLSTILIAAITTSIYLYMSVLQRQQLAIEKTQIARNVLNMMKSDIRAALLYIPADVTGLDALNVSQEAIAGLAGGVDLSGIDMSSLGGSGQPDGTESDDGQSEEDSATQNIASGGTRVLRPGLYGNSTAIMVDVSRLPRIDQYDPIAVGSEAAAVLSDVKTVAYFVSGESLETSQVLVGTDSAVSGGLYRRELDRAVASYSSDQAGTLAALGKTKLIANEIVSVEFRYFDGENWSDEWDSDSMGGFPSAVEINILVDNKRSISSEENYSMQPNPLEGQYFRTVVSLPAAEELTPEELELINGTGGSP